jgi:simple sugar transport system ATP-binding protein
MSGPRIELERVTRRYGDFRAVANASVRFEPGQIHAVIGENGAGKSTLLKMAAGALAPSEGRVLASGVALDASRPEAARGAGVGLVHQHFMLVAALRAIENLVLGAEPVDKFRRLDLASARRRAEELMEETGLRVPLDVETGDLTVGERQRLEILRVLFRGARAILLDEPTAVLSPIEVGDLYATLGRLAEGGATIALVTHRLDEVVRFANRVTVMRRGEVTHARELRAGSAGPSEWNTSPQAGDCGAKAANLEDELTRAIMGGAPPPEVIPPPLDPNAPIALSIEGLTLASEQGPALLDGTTLSARAGEIVGIAGVEGNGQRELVRALAGLEDHARGRVAVFDIPLEGPPSARRGLLGVVHEDRHETGLLLEATVADNLVLGDLGGGDAAERALVARRMREYDVRPPDPARLAGELSGGNQQKIVCARAVDRLVSSGAKGALVLAQPTRGVDIGAAATIHAAIFSAAAKGLPVIVVSADLAELRRVAHRIVVMRRGRIVATFAPDADESDIGRAMLGVEAA